MTAKGAILAICFSERKGSERVEPAYMTGILPIKKYGEHSAINIFREYFVIEPGDPGAYFGFTETEVREQCRAYGVDYEEMKNGMTAIS